MKFASPDWLREIAEEVNKNPERWAKDVAARDANDTPCLPTDPAAAKWDLHGFRVRDGIRLCDYEFLTYYSEVARNDSCKTPAEFVAWLREMAKELEVQS